MADRLVALAKGYLGVGVAILAIQLAAGRFLVSQTCDGEHHNVLIERSFPRVDDSTLLLHPETNRNGLSWGAFSHVVRWAPDLYTQVIAGKMGLGDYLRGGSECRPALRVTDDRPWMK